MLTNDKSLVSVHIAELQAEAQANRLAGQTGSNRPQMRWSIARVLRAAGSTFQERTSATAARS